MTKQMQVFINANILSQAKGLKYTVSALAPSTEVELFNSPSLVVWSGASDNTIYGDKNVNWAFRAIHDDIHLKTRLNFSPAAEVEMGRIQASKQSSLLMQELIYCEVSLQALHFLKTGNFVQDQVAFTLKYLESKGLL